MGEDNVISVAASVKRAQEEKARASAIFRKTAREARYLGQLEELVALYIDPANVALEHGALVMKVIRKRSGR